MYHTYAPATLTKQVLSLLVSVRVLVCLSVQKLENYYNLVATCVTVIILDFIDI